MPFLFLLTLLLVATVTPLHAASPSDEAAVLERAAYRVLGVPPGAPARQVLGVAVGATSEEIRLAFRSASKRHHPDRYATDPARHRVQGVVQRILSAAHEELTKGPKPAAITVAGPPPVEWPIWWNAHSGARRAAGAPRWQAPKPEVLPQTLEEWKRYYVARWRAHAFIRGVSNHSIGSVLGAWATQPSVSPAQGQALQSVAIAIMHSHWAEERPNPKAPVQVETYDFLHSVFADEALLEEARAIVARRLNHGSFAAFLASLLRAPDSEASLDYPAAVGVADRFVRSYGDRYFVAADLSAAQGLRMGSLLLDPRRFALSVLYAKARADAIRYGVMYAPSKAGPAENAAFDLVNKASYEELLFFMQRPEAAADASARARAYIERPLGFRDLLRPRAWAGYLSSVSARLRWRLGTWMPRFRSARHCAALLDY